MSSNHTYYNFYKEGSVLSPVFHYSQVMTKDFVPKNGKMKKMCDSAYCRKIDKDTIENMKKKYIEGCDLLLGLLGD